MENTTVALKDAGGLTMDATAFTSAKAELSRRTVLFASAGTLTTTIDNTDSLTDKAKFVLAGEEAVVASLEVTAQNEDITIEDFKVTIANTAGNITADEATAALSELILVDQDMNELARKTVSGLTVTFENANVEVTEGTRNFYIKVVTNPIGQDQPGAQSKTDITLNLDVTQARGQKLIADGDVAASGASNEFGVVPVRVASLAFTDKFDQTEVSSTLGVTTNNVAILAVENSNHSTTQSSDGTSVETNIDYIAMSTTVAGATVDNYFMERINGGGDRVTSYTGDVVPAGTSFTITLADVADAAGANNEIQFTINDTLVEVDALDDGANPATGNEEAAAVDAKLTALIVAGQALEGKLTVARAGAVVTVTALENLYVKNTTANVNAIAGFDATAQENVEIFNTSSLSSDGSKLEAGETGYFLIQALVSAKGAGDNDDSISIGLSDLNNGSITFRSDTADSSNNSAINELRLSSSRLSDATLQETRNSLQ
jgi:hypothetical protein